MFAKHTWLGLLLSLSVLMAAPARAQESSVESALTRFFDSATLEREWFAPSFLAQVPFEQIQVLRDRLVADLGTFVRVRPEEGRWAAEYARGSVPCLASLDGEGRFVGLRLLAPVVTASSADDLVGRMAALPGEGSLLIVRDGIEMVAVEPDRPFAVGSAFKLVVLRALVEAIDEGTRHWGDVVALRASQRSLPSGTLAQWPDGALLTLYSLAARMIAESDNTATDALIDLLGRDAVEAADPSGRNRPFLTTAEAFKLKDPANASWLEAWRDGDEAARREVLASIAPLALPTAAIFDAGPRATDVEWWFTARELCALIDELSGSDLMTINPGVVARSDFARVAYKGGSEPGVLNLTTWARADDGARMCVCATRNADVEIPLETLSGIVGAAFGWIAEQP